MVTVITVVATVLMTGMATMIEMSVAIMICLMSTVRERDG